MSRTVFTGWRNVTPGPCLECGDDDQYFSTGRGDVFCACQCCPDCGEEPGWHATGCPESGTYLAGDLDDALDCELDTWRPQNG